MSQRSATWIPRFSQWCRADSRRPCQLPKWPLTNWAAMMLLCRRQLVLQVLLLPPSKPSRLRFHLWHRQRRSCLGPWPPRDSWTPLRSVKHSRSPGRTASRIYSPRTMTTSSARNGRPLPVGKGRRNRLGTSVMSRASETTLCAPTSHHDPCRSSRDAVAPRRMSLQRGAAHHQRSRHRAPAKAAWTPWVVTCSRHQAWHLQLLLCQPQVQRMAYRTVGVGLLRDFQLQWALGQRLPGPLLPGPLLFFTIQRKRAHNKVTVSRQEIANINELQG